jgi:hypothetical protein
LPNEELIDIILKVASGEANENDLYTWIKKSPSLMLNIPKHF